MAEFKQPDNLSIAQPNTFKFVLTKIPNVVYNIQRVDIPGVAISGIIIPTGPFAHVDIPVPGEKLTFDPLSVGAVLDEDYIGWAEIQNWILRCSTAPGNSNPKVHPIKELSDATLLVNNNKFNSNLQVTFYNMFPTLLSPIPLDLSLAPDSPIIYDITFSYSHYEFKLLNR